MPLKGALSAELSRKIVACLDQIATGTEGSGGEPSGDEQPQPCCDAVRKAALDRLRDYAEGDSRLLLPFGRDFAVIPTLARVLQESDDPDILMCALALLAQVIPVAKKKNTAALCTEECLSNLLSLMDSSPPDMAAAVCSILTTLVRLDSSTKDRFWSLCSKKSTDGGRTERPNELCSIDRTSA
eukprot:RCo028505